ncbi:MAG TPA: alcohol dehydrogenase catalytic domain-containing protein [Candidatus Limnocylindrales bacterium]|nr:alcohol dehydrogenase catalytic domain-containing protein [Candidatus Limnocylindrales bacterium]
MRAYRMTSWGDEPRVVEVPIPEPGPGQVLIRVAGCGLCHSDFTMRRMPEPAGRALGWAMPYTMGHETAGWIASPAHGFTIGDPVALVSPNSCGRCDFCRKARDNCCPAGVLGRGYGRDGGLAEYVLVDDPRALLPLGDLDPRTAGPLTDAGATAYHAVRRALPRLLSGGAAAVIGTGGLGSFALQFLLLAESVSVVAVDTNPQALNRATDLGVHERLSSIDKLAQRSQDVVLDFVGTDETIAAGVAAVRPGGSYGLIGAAGGRLNKPWFHALPRDGEIFTFQGGTIADARDVIALAAQGRIRNDVTIFPLTQIEEAYTLLASAALPTRAIIDPTTTQPPT